MRPKDKARLYHDLGELIRSGMALPRAVEKLGQHSRGAAGRTLEGIGAVLASGGTLTDALRGEREISEMDAALLSACERAGKLERGFALAAEYYGALAEARSRIWQKAAYPLLVAHVAVVAFSVVRLMKGSISDVGQAMLLGFGCLWGAIFFGSMLVGFIGRQAARHAALDRSLGMIPVIGSMRSDLALSRFSAAYDMQLEAGVNVIGALEASGRATASARYRDAVDKALPEVRSGESVSTALVATRAFPERLIRAFLVGEESGRLDQELRNVSEEYRIGALRKLDLLSEWVPRIFYLIVVVVVAWQIIEAYTGYFRTIQDMSRG